MTIRISGDDILGNLKKAVNKRRQNIALAQDSVLDEIVTWIKGNHETMGGWHTVTGDLTNSIDYFPSHLEGDTIKANLHAGMRYAPHVEFKPNHWVLSGGINEFFDKFVKMVAERVDLL